MLRAYTSMPADEFIAQLRVYVIALGLGPHVVDCVDNLTGIDDNEDTHAAEIDEAEKEGETRGRENMKAEIISDITAWLESQPNYDMIAAPCEAVLKLIEKIEV